MKVWNYGEMSNKVIGDLDLQDETFVQYNELVGYFNEAIGEAEAEIHGTREDYFLKSYNFPCVVGVNSYPLPDDIYINKIRGFVYSNGTVIYDIKRIKVWHEFNNIALTQSFGPSDDYRYIIQNTSPGNIQLLLVPKSRETAVLPQLNPSNSSIWFTPMILWYVRNAQRIPITGEYIVDWEQYVLPSQVSTVTSTLTLTQTTYVTGDQIKLLSFAAPGGSSGLPAPLVSGVIYYVIVTGTPGVIKLATTAANAAAGTNIVLTSTGSATGYFNLYYAATTNVINSLLIDIPEFATFIMQWVKCRCMEKEGDPRLTGAVQTLEQQRKQLVDTLTEMVVDIDTEIQADFTHYQEMT